MAEYYTHFSVLLPVGAGNVEAALALYGLLEAELDAGSEAIGFAAEAYDRTDDTVWLWDGGGCGDPEHVIAFAFRCAEAFRLAGLLQSGAGMPKPPRSTRIWAWVRDAWSILLVRSRPFAA